jgi:hypothetical protein
VIDTTQPYVTSDLGELAYVAYWRVCAPLALPWDTLTNEERRAWRAAALAVKRGTLRLVRPPPAGGV